MYSGQYAVVSSLLFLLVSTAHSQPLTGTSPENSTADAVIQLPSAGNRKIGRERDDLYCDSWRLTVETNDAGYWSTIPDRCLQFVKDYMTGDRYSSDSDLVAEDSLNFAKSVTVAGDGRDAWVFDIDETLLSNLNYYEIHGFGSEAFDEVAFNEWEELAKAPALPASLSVYKELQQLGFKIFLLTGRSEPSRNATVKNLHDVGYENWERLILRGPSDEGKLAIIYKSEKRRELGEEGYRIHGNSGDQWSDLLGDAMARRSFKLPNPMYYIS